MKISNCPSLLYKYLAPERLDVLTTGMLRYTQLGAFNDPFEGQPHITRLMPHDQSHNMLQSSLSDEIIRSYQDLDMRIRASISLQIYYMLCREIYSEKESTIKSEVEKFSKIITNLVPKTLDNVLGVLSLSEIPDSILMWSHYGASHTGFVLEFNAHHPYFHEEKSINDEFRHLRPVRYREARPSGCMTELEGIDHFLVKSSHWSYEREWRILRPLKDANEINNVQPYPIHLYRFPPESLKSVIVGSRCTKSISSSIINIISKRREYSHINFKWAVADEKRFILNIKDGMN